MNQLPKVSLPVDCRYHAVRPGPLHTGVVILSDGAPDEPQDIVEATVSAVPVSDGDGDDEPEAEPPTPFEYNEDLED